MSTTSVEENEKWDLVIQSKRRLFDIDFKAIWDYRDLIGIFVRRDIVAMYKQTIMGPLWFFLGPLFTVVAYTFVFNTIAGIATDGIPAPVFYLAGTAFWGYFQQCFTATSNTFVLNAGMFGKVYFPRLITPLSVIISNLFKFAIQLLMFLCVWGYFLLYTDSGASMQPNMHLFLLPVLIIMMGGIALGLGMIISSLTTKYRDLTYFLSFGVTLLMYITPVIYPVSQIPDRFKPLVLLNPIAPLVETFRFAFTGAGAFSWESLGYSAGFMVVVLAVGILIFNKIERTFMDTV